VANSFKILLHSSFSAIIWSLMLITTARISARTLAEFMTSSPSTQRRIVRTSKYPSDDEAKAIVTYYREARASVERFFNCGGQSSILDAEIRRLAGEGGRASAARSARLGQNVRAIREFQRGSLSAGNFKTVERPMIELIVADVCLKVRPSLSLRDQAENIHWVFLDFSEGRLDERKAGIVLQLFVQAARHEHIDLKPRFAEYHHVSSGRTQYGLRHGSRLEAQITASCQTFSDIWSLL
jgi:hypothetical protein